jgi:hypothetical protein
LLLIRVVPVLLDKAAAAPVVARAVAVLAHLPQLVQLVLQVAVILQAVRAARPVAARRAVLPQAGLVLQTLKEAAAALVVIPGRLAVQAVRPEAAQAAAVTVGVTLAPPLAVNLDTSFSELLPLLHTLTASYFEAD